MTTTDTPTAPQAPTPEPQLRPWYRKKRHIAWMAVLALIALVVAFNDTQPAPAADNRTNELRAEIVALEEELTEVRDENTALNADNAELQTRIDGLVTIDEPEGDPGTNGEPEPEADPGGEVELDDARTSSRANPFSIGDTVYAGDDWEYSITKVTLDAWDEIRAENQFNDPPASGEQFVMFKMKATYTGDDIGNAYAFTASIIGGNGNTFTTYGNSAGVIPDAFDENSDVYPGASISGNMAIAVPSKQVDDAVIRMDVDDDTYDTYRGFFTLK